MDKSQNHRENDNIHVDNSTTDKSNNGLGEAPKLSTLTQSSINTMVIPTDSGGDTPTTTVGIDEALQEDSEVTFIGKSTDYITSPSSPLMNPDEVGEFKTPLSLIIPEAEPFNTSLLYEEDDVTIAKSVCQSQSENNPCNTTTTTIKINDISNMKSVPTDFSCPYCSETESTEPTLTCSNTKCRNKVHYSCSELPLYQIYNFKKTSRKFECKTCTEIPESFDKNRVKKLTQLPGNQIETSNEKLAETKSVECQTTTNLSTTPCINQGLEDNLAKLSCELAKMSQSILDNQKMNENRMHNIEENYIFKLLDSEQSKAKIEIEHLESDNIYLKDCIKRKEAELDNIQATLLRKIDHLDFKMQENDVKYERKITSLEKNCLNLSKDIDEPKSMHTAVGLKIEEIEQKLYNMSKELSDFKSQLDERSNILSNPLQLKEYSKIAAVSQREPAKEKHPDSQHEKFTYNKFSPLSSTLDKSKITTNRNMKSNPIITEETNVHNIDVLIVGNSHTKKLISDRFYRNRKCWIKTLDEKNINGARDYIKTCQFKQKIVLYQVTSNDLVNNSVEYCLHILKLLIQETYERYPDCQIIFGTPLLRKLDTEAQTNEYNTKCEELITKISDIEKIKLINHSNIKLCPEFFVQEQDSPRIIHLSSKGIGLMVRNFKKMLNPLLGLGDYLDFDQFGRSRYTSQSFQQNRYVPDYNQKRYQPYQSPYDSQNNNGIYIRQGMETNHFPDGSYKTNMSNKNVNNTHNTNLLIQGIQDLLKTFSRR